MNPDDDAYIQPFIDAWRPVDDLMQAVLDPMIDTFEQLRADAYERGRAIAEARAESRIALGLPLSREPR